MEILDSSSVLILDESSIHQQLLSKWISEVNCKMVSSKNDIHAEWDPTVTVACLSQTALEDDIDSIRNYILNRNPYCQIIGMLPRSSFVSPFKDQFDEIIQRPIFKEEFQQTIEYRFIAGVYSNLLSEFYGINATLVAINRASGTEVDKKQQTIDKIQERYEELNTQLDLLQKELSSDTIISILETLERHNQYLTKPNADADTGRETKFRPRRCPSCKLPWGVDHRNELGDGYKILGADVYQCARCETIMHGLAGEQRVF